MIFSVFQKNLGFWVFLVHPTVVSVLLSASVERCFVSRLRDFFIKPFLAPAPISLTILSYKVLAVLFPDCQKSVFVVLKTENRLPSVKTQLCSTLDYTVHKLYTRLTHPKQLGGMPDTFLVSLTDVWCPWCPWHVYGVPHRSLVSLTQLYRLQKVWCVLGSFLMTLTLQCCFDTTVVSPKCLFFPLQIFGVPDTPLVSPTSLNVFLEGLWYFGHICDICIYYPYTHVVS